jgi:endonuclease-3
VNTDLPEKTRVELEKWLPEEYWTSVNKVLVGFGQTVCLPLASSRRCDICPVNTLCPSSFKGTTVKKPAGFKKAKLE